MKPNQSGSATAVPSDQTAVTATQQYRESRSKRVALFADGLCEPRNPGGYACWAWCAFDADGREIANGFGCIGHGAEMSNNLAEYTAAVRALEWAATHDVQPDVHADSRLVVEQSVGSWNCNALHLRPLRDQVRDLLCKTGGTLNWVPREQNTRADALSRKAYDEARKGGQDGRRQS